MVQPRTELQMVLESVLGSENVYFQPPPNIRMEYPAIVYNLEHDHVQYADDMGYVVYRRYHVSVIDRNPDSPIAERMRKLRHCTFSNMFAVDGLNQFNFTLYF